MVNEPLTEDKIKKTMEIIFEYGIAEESLRELLEEEKWVRTDVFLSAVRLLREKLKEVTKVDTEEDNCNHSYQIEEIEDAIDEFLGVCEKEVRTPESIARAAKQLRRRFLNERNEF